MGKAFETEKIKIDLPEDVKYIIRKLNEQGFEGYAVGGCVRDAVLCKKPADWDITTSAKPEQVKKIFKRTVDTGIKHGTVTVLLCGGQYEVTTYRVDGNYTDKRHPESVSFTPDLTEDLKRRDFTINAMAYNEDHGLVDLFGGLDDLNLGIIRCVGNPEHRFLEDALRIMRALRFSAQLGFEIENDTLCAIKKLRDNLRDISSERVRDELEKIILSDHPEKLIEAYELGITGVIFPEFDRMMECPQISPYHSYDVGRHTIEVVRNVSKEPVIRYAALLHDIAKPLVKKTDPDKGRDHFPDHAKKGSELAGKILRRFKLDNKTIRIVVTLIEHHSDWPTKEGFSPEVIRRHVGSIGKTVYPMYLELHRADAMGKSVYGMKSGMKDYEYSREQYEIIIRDNVPVELCDLSITGKDLIDLGCPEGKEIGAILNMLMDHIYGHPVDNTKEKLTEIVLAFIHDKNHSK